MSAVVRVLDRDPEPGPVEELEVVLAVSEGDRALRREADVLGDEREPASLRDRRARELEEVRQRLGDVEPLAEPLLQAGPELVEPHRVVDDDELRRRPLDPAEQVADLVQRDALEVGVGARVLGDRGDVEVVVDVAVEREALVLDRGDRLAGELERDRLVQEPRRP